MISRKWLPTLVGLPPLTLCAFTLPYKTGVPDSNGTANDEQAIRQLNEQCLHGHDIADAVTPDGVEDADFTVSGDFGAQLVDNTQATNTAGAGINKSLTDEVGAGRGNILTPNSSLFTRPTAIPSAPSAADANSSRESSRRPRVRDRMKATASAISTPTMPSAPGSPTVALCAMADPAARPGQAATSTRVLTAATLRTCSAWA